MFFLQLLHQFPKFYLFLCCELSTAFVGEGEHAVFALAGLYLFEFDILEGVGLGGSGDGFAGEWVVEDEVGEGERDEVFYYVGGH